MLLASGSLDSVIALTRAGRYAEAQAAIAREPEPVELRQKVLFHRLKAAIESGLGHNGKAAAEMRAASQLVPQDQSVLFAAAVAERQAGEWNNALQHAKALPDSAQVWELRGEMEERLGHYLEAEKALQAAVAGEPGNEQYHLALGLELVQHHSFQPALLVLEPAAAKFPLSARMRVLAGVAAYGAGQNQRAVEWLSAAVKLDPGLLRARGYLVGIAFEGAAPLSPETVAVLCLKLDSACFAARARRAHADDRQDRLAEAMASLRRADAKDALAHCELGQAYEWRNNLPSAIAELRRCVALDPLPRNHYRLSRLYGRLGRTAEQRAELNAYQEAKRKLSMEVEARSRARSAVEFLMQ